jgi:hypothetical protein
MSHQHQIQSQRLRKACGQYNQKANVSEDLVILAASVLTSCIVMNGLMPSTDMLMLQIIVGTSPFAMDTGSAGPRLGHP